MTWGPPQRQKHPGRIRQGSEPLKWGSSNLRDRLVNGSAGTMALKGNPEVYRQPDLSSEPGYVPVSAMVARG